MISLPLSDIVLIQGPLVGASGMRPLADRLRARGLHVHLPDVLLAHNILPPWSAWSSHLIDLLSLDGRKPILVGFSASTTLAAELATKIPAQGIIFLDGDIPPESGRIAPGSERLRRRVQNLADCDGQLPLWSDWWGSEEEKAAIGVTILQRDPNAWEEFRRDQPRMTRTWFDDEIDLAPWDRVPAGYVQLSRFFDCSAEEAEKRGWPVARLNGTHLHPSLEPEETAAAILEVCLSLAWAAQQKRS
jgi:pimeloyl-ACP methyl ester carboxylesterase